VMASAGTTDEVATAEPQADVTGASDDAAADVDAHEGTAHAVGGAIASAAASLAGSVGSAASAAGSAASAAASVAADSMGSVARPIIHEVEELASGARRRLDERGRARKRSASRGKPSDPLKLLYDVHPEARRAAPREIGLKIVPIESILGTAVEGPAQRGSDFLPLKPRRGADWEARFHRIQNALERLDTLPPVDLLRFGDGYWILDGHNRVGAGLKLGQVAVDANVTDLRMPGSTATASRIAPYLEGSGDLRAAGTGRRRSTSRGRESVEPSRLAAERQALHDAEADDAVTKRTRDAADGEGGA
ncbi:MAG: hypothetical protein M3472_06505, partial [Chloroflexota bacterium]|nr:hypothetical protein [Chloroflexota bacterium]